MWVEITNVDIIPSRMGRNWMKKPMMLPKSGSYRNHRLIDHPTGCYENGLLAERFCSAGRTQYCVVKIQLQNTPQICFITFGDDI
jgi:hypothetical protein